MLSFSFTPLQTDIWPFFPIILVLTFHNALSIHSHCRKWQNLCDTRGWSTYDGNLVLVLVGNVPSVGCRILTTLKVSVTKVLAMHISTKETAEGTKKSSRDCRLLPKYHSEEYQYSYRDIMPSVKYNIRSPKAKQKTTPLQSLSTVYPLTSLGKISCTKPNDLS